MTHLWSILVYIVFLSSCFSLDFGYHKYSSMAKFLRNFTEQNPQLARLYSIGKSVQGRDLFVVELSAAEKNKIGIPNVKLIGNIHGNEAVGREILLHFLEFMVNNYSSNLTIAHFLNTTRLHILPSLNPDGFENASVICDRGEGRNNANDKDLNRSFPDYFRTNNKNIQPETRAVQKWMNETQFVLSASLHGGALVANYPYENYKEDVWELTFRLHESSSSSESSRPYSIKFPRSIASISMPMPPSISPDDDVFKHLAIVYATKHPTMHQGITCPGTEQRFKDGIVNGAAWYPVTGGMQDYNYAFHGCMEVTLEISCCKYPEKSELSKFWEENKLALLDYIMAVHSGVRGQVIDGVTKKPIRKAILKIIGREMNFTTTDKGEFWRILLPNTYTLQVIANGYNSTNTSFVLLRPKRSNFPQMKFLTIEMFPRDYVIPTTTTDASTMHETEQDSVEKMEAVVQNSAKYIRNSFLYLVVSLFILNLT